MGFLRSLCGLRWACILLVVSFAATQEEAPQSQPDICRDLGFTGTQACSECQRLGQYVNDQDLVDECNGCCDASISTGKHKSATLEICQHRLRDYPHISEFVKRKAAAYESLSITHPYAALPKLILKGGRPREVIRIDRWKTEHIEEYLDARLA